MDRRGVAYVVLEGRTALTNHVYAIYTLSPLSTAAPWPVRAGNVQGTGRR